jgi:3-oxoacyl-[acyl-carrier protein] reductase
MTGERRVAVVSGGSRGLGQAIVADLLQSGAVVATFSRSATEFVDQCRARDPQADSFLFQALDGADVKRLKQFTLDVLGRYGRIDVLVNNMAAGSAGLLTLQREPEIHRQIALNFESAVFLTRACLKAMLPQGAGAIVNVASVNALRGHAGVSVYSATKAALIGLTRSLAAEVGPGGIRVNCVAPGYFDSEMTAELNDQQRERIVRRTPLRRLGTVRDVVGLVRFLLSPDAEFITGQVIAVDGGFTS